MKVIIFFENDTFKKITESDKTTVILQHSNIELIVPFSSIDYKR
jgi:hypothetical protein